MLIVKDKSLHDMALFLLIASIGLLLGWLVNRRLCSVNATSQLSQKRVKFRLITHNIRYAATQLESGEAPWRERLPLLVAHFRYHTAQTPDAIICMQEVLHHQLADLKLRLNASEFSKCQGFPQQESPVAEWQTVGVGRDDGKQAGEYAPIWFRPAAWELKRWDTVWLSPTPMKPGWGAGSNRIVTIALLRHRASSQELVVMNTHLDEQSGLARQKAAEILVRLVDMWSKPQQTTVLLAGDLNSETDGQAYHILSTAMTDSRMASDNQVHYGENFTYTGFNNLEQRQRLDYIFITPSPNALRETLHVKSTAVLPNRFELGDTQHMFHSDHRAVTADMELEP